MTHDLEKLMRVGRAMRNLAVSGAHSLGISDGSNDANSGLNDALAARAQHLEFEWLLNDAGVPEGNTKALSDAYAKGYKFSLDLYAKYNGEIHKTET
jgi:hypothetical protein